MQERVIGTAVTGSALHYHGAEENIRASALRFRIQGYVLLSGQKVIIYEVDKKRSPAAIQIYR